MFDEKQLKLIELGFKDVNENLQKPYLEGAFAELDFPGVVIKIHEPLSGGEEPRVYRRLEYSRAVQYMIYGGMLEICDDFGDERESTNALLREMRDFLKGE